MVECAQILVNGLEDVHCFGGLDVPLKSLPDIAWPDNGLRQLPLPFTRELLMLIVLRCWLRVCSKIAETAKSNLRGLTLRTLMRRRP